MPRLNPHAASPCKLEFYQVPRKTAWYTNALLREGGSDQWAGREWAGSRLGGVGPNKRGGGKGLGPFHDGMEETGGHSFRAHQGLEASHH